MDHVVLAQHCAEAYIVECGCALRHLKDVCQRLECLLKASIQVIAAEPL